MSITNLTIEQVNELEPSYSPIYPDKLEVRTSTIANAGNGCFSKVSISTGATIGVYSGFTHDHTQYINQGKRRFAKINSEYTMEISENNRQTKYITINGLYGGNELRYINGCANQPSIDANVNINDDGEIYAIKSISADDELFMDY